MHISALLTIICFFIILFIKCCSYKTKSTVNAKSEYYDNYDKRGGQSNRGLHTVDEDEEDDDSEYNTSKFCKCTNFLCPFAFYTVFVLLAFLCCLFGIGV